MSEFVVVVFPDQTKAYDGLHALSELHSEGSITLYGTAVVRRENNGALSIKERSDQGPIGTALGLLLGSLLGVFGGPAGMVAGAAGGAMLGSARDLLHVNVSEDFLDEVEKELGPEKYAVVAELSEDWTAPIDVRMAALGGKIIREERDTFVDEMMERRADTWKRNVQQWRTQRASAEAGHMEDQLDAYLEREQKRLQAMADKARNKIEERKAELNAKLGALQEQAAKAKPDVRRRIEQRITDMRREFDDREQKLNRAYELSKEALKPESRA